MSLPVLSSDHDISPTGENSGRYEVRLITSEGEHVRARFASLDAAFTDCLLRWRLKSVHAVLDTETEQRWSFRDIQDVRQQEKANG